MMNSAPLIGVHYESDNIAVYQAIKQWCLDTAAWAWVRTYDKDQNGRAAMEAIRQHYDGPGETRRQLAKAKADLKVIHYKNEQSLPFETYIHKLNEVFFVFGKAKQPVYEEQKVGYMLDNINTSNVELQAAVTLIRMDDNIKDLPTPEGYFIRAANKMAEQIAVISPSTIGKKSRFISSIDGG